MDDENDEHFFIRLRKEKKFANEVLLFESRDLLRRAINFYVKKPENKDVIINSIGYSIDRNLTSKDKLKVIHAILLDSGNLSIVGFKNLYIAKSNVILDFVNTLNNLLSDIEIEEGVRISERAEIITKLNKEHKNTKEPLTGFKNDWNNNRINLLYEAFKGKYVNNHITFKQFSAIFKQDPLPENYTIEWEKSNVLLSYFIKCVFYKENYLNVWSKSEKIFTKRNKYLKNLKKSEVNNPQPKGYEEIDEILKNIYSHLQ